MRKHVIQRRRDGVVYTPPAIVRHILRQTLEVWLQEEPALPRLLDPACGEGAFLAEAYRRLLRRRPEASELRGRIAILRECIFGIDTDRAAVETTRGLLSAMARDGPVEETGRKAPVLEETEKILAQNVQCGDALAGGSFVDQRPFQVIVANPPFVGARRLAKHRGKIGDRYRHEYDCVQGSCDLYVVFLERICELLDRGGRYGVIAPNRIAVADYAKRCRELLLTHTQIDRIDDLSAINAFPSAAVYPVILCGVKETPAAEHRVRVHRAQSLEKLEESPCCHVAQSEIDAGRGFPLRPDLELESRVPTRPLGELATLHSGTTGFAARRVADVLVEREQAAGEAWDFITTGNIDRYRIRIGDVQFLGAAYRRPVLPRDAGFLTERKRRLYAAPKIVFAGLTRRPEAAWSPGELALGVQVYAAADCREDPFYFLGLLNSKLFACLFRARFVGRRMSGGYLAVTKSQLARLPIRTVGRERRARQLREEISAAASCLSHAMAEDRQDAAPDPQAAGLEQRIDQLVFELYCVRDDEIATVEGRDA